MGTTFIGNPEILVQCKKAIDDVEMNFGPPSDVGVHFHRRGSTSYFEIVPEGEDDLDKFIVWKQVVENGGF